MSPGGHFEIGELWKVPLESIVMSFQGSIGPNDYDQGSRCLKNT